MKGVKCCLMNYKYDVSIIVVNYNGKRYIDHLFTSLKEVAYNNMMVEVVFVDNDSSDGSVKYLKCKYEDAFFSLKIVKNEENFGFAGGNNAGVLASEGRYVILLNNDTKVEKDWLIEIYKCALKNQEAVMINSKLLFYYDFMPIQLTTTDKVIIGKEISINGEKYIIDGKYCKNVLCQENHIVCFGNSELFIPLLQGECEYEIELFILSNNDTKAMFIYGQKKQIINNAAIKLYLAREEILAEKVSLIQNAGSGINDDYDGYDIGFGERDSEKYSQIYEINNGCGASIMMKREDFINCGMFDERFFMYYEDVDLSYRLKNGDNKKIFYCPTSIVRHIHTGSSTEWSPFFVYHVSRNKLLFIYKNISKVVYIKYFFCQILSAIKRKNIYIFKGCIDSLRIIAGKENIMYKSDKSN